MSLKRILQPCVKLIHIGLAVILDVRALLKFLLRYCCDIRVH
jgi:hypothetical protein